MKLSCGARRRRRIAWLGLLMWAMPGVFAATVQISNFSFQPSSVNINVGDTVEWVQDDATIHTTTSDSGVWDSGILSQNQTFSFTFQAAGSYPYHCAIHSFMKGAVNVAAAQPATIRISGAVQYYQSGIAVAQATVTLSGDTNLTAVTAADGSYAFTVNAGGNYTVTPSKTSDSPPNNGVTTLDIALIRRHILAIAPLASADAVLAADVDGSQTVTTLDIALIRRVILGITDSFPIGLWKFVPSNAAFADPLYPWPTPAARSYSAVSGDQTGQDFVAIKLGDVRAAWTP